MAAVAFSDAVEMLETASRWMEGLPAVRGAPVADVDPAGAARAMHAGETVKATAAKMAFLVGSGGGASDAVALSALLKEVSGAGLALSAACAGCLQGHYASRALMSGITQGAEAVLAALRALVSLAARSALGSANAGSPPAEALTRAAGTVVVACDGISRLPWTNRIAIGRSIARAARTVDDARHELADGLRAGDEDDEEELDVVEEVIRGVAHASLADGPTLETTDAEGEIVEELTETEEATARAVLHVLDRVTQFYRHALRTLQSVPEGQSDWEAWDRADSCCLSLTVALDELAAEAYPPQDREELSERAAAVAAIVTRLSHAALPAWAWETALGGIQRDVEVVCRAAAAAEP